VRIFLGESSALLANSGYACGCCFPLGGVVVVILSVLRLWVKTLDLAASMAAALCVVTLLGALLWSRLDTTQLCFFVFVVLVIRVFLFFIFDLLYKSFFSPPCIGSIVGCYIIYSGSKACFAMIGEGIPT
jgi:hypothetical protein